MTATKTRVLYFAGARDAAGTVSELIELTGPVTVGALLERITAMHPKLGPLRPSIRVAVNHEIVLESSKLAGGEEVGILPPVAGG